MRKLGVIIGILGVLCFIVLAIHQFTGIDGFDNRKINIQSNDFKIYMSDSTGKLKATYTGDNDYGAIIIEKENFKNTYVLKKNETDILSCTYGNGDYTLSICEKGPEDEELDVVEKCDVYLNISDQLAPFKGISYYTTKDAEIDKIANNIKSSDQEDFVNKAYDYMIKNIGYDNSLAQVITENKINIYKPNIDEVINNKKGICLDQASLLGSLIKSRGIPVRIVIGWNNRKAYHAWVEVLLNGKWLMYDSTLKKTYLNEEASTYEAVNYY